MGLTKCYPVCVVASISGYLRCRYFSSILIYFAEHLQTSFIPVAPISTMICNASGVIYNSINHFGNMCVHSIINN